MKYNDGMKINTKKFREKHPNYDNEWRKKNREKIRLQQRNFYQRHLERQKMRSLIKNRKSRKENPEKWREWDKKYQHTPGRIFTVYKKGAKSRGIIFDIEKDYFIKFINKPCRYCGENAIGVDRIDNKKGYVVGNIGPCCKWCNRMKMDHDEQEFINHCKKIVDYGK
jgi:hypothetical protein